MSHVKIDEVELAVVHNTKSCELNQENAVAFYRKSDPINFSMCSTSVHLWN